jgi:alpha-tubulin suppressor-like RCC1 family protein
MRRSTLSWALFGLLFGILVTAAPLACGAEGENGGPARVAVTAGSAHCQALGPDGGVWGWGMVRFGNLAEGSSGGHKECKREPVRAKGPGGKGLLTGIVELSCRVGTTCALRNDGTVLTWGLGAGGQLGNGAARSSALPVEVKGLKDVVAVAAGHTHCLALKKDGTVWAWGLNDRGQLGNGSSVEQSAEPVQVKDPEGKGALGNVTGIAAGVGHCLALQKDGTVLAWGENVVGQVGDGTLTDRFLPVKVEGIKDAVSVGAGYYNSLVTCKDGSLWGWGYNVFGQLADGTTVDRYRPVRAKGPDGKAFITNAARAVGGSLHTLILLKDGTLLACGSNHFCQLGNGKPCGRQILPVQVRAHESEGPIKDVIDMDGGSVHSVAATKDGKVYCWGDNYRGQIGSNVPGSGWAFEGKFVDYEKGRGDKIYKKGALKVSGVPWPWPVKLPPAASATEKK